MTTRDKTPTGAPCWVDLWTSDVEGSRRFYSELFGWEAAEPSPEFGGYWMFLRDGVPVAGGMGAMPGAPADDTWTPYFHTADATKAVATARSLGAETPMEPTAVADLGTQCVLHDPAGAKFGLWQPGSFAGFSVLNEHGSPSWFELHTPEYAPVVDFYAKVLGWTTDVISDSDEMRYQIVRDADSDGTAHVAGLFDSTKEGTGPRWFTYWEVDDVDAVVKTAESLGGRSLREPTDTPYGRMGWLVDPSGAAFNLRRA